MFCFCSNMPTRTCLIERRTDHQGTTLFFVVRGDKRARSRFFEPDDVPVFEGGAAWFEVETGRKRWRVIRRVKTS